MPQMNSKTKSVGEIFTGTTKFEVPKHQRDFSWTGLEVEEHRDWSPTEITETQLRMADAAVRLWKV